MRKKALSFNFFFFFFEHTLLYIPAYIHINQSKCINDENTIIWFELKVFFFKKKKRYIVFPSTQHNRPV